MACFMADMMQTKINSSLLVLNLCLLTVLCLLQESRGQESRGQMELGQVESDVSFDRDIRPLLTDRCFACHGPDPESREAGLRLDKTDGPEGAYEMSAIVPGSLDDSEIWTRINSDDPSTVMPPPDAHKKSFTAQEKHLLQRWIGSGAKYEQFWAFKVPVAVTQPPVKGQGQTVVGPIDAFVAKRLGDKIPAGKADLRTLIRRVTFDLTGLPPSPEQIAAFIADCQSQGQAEAWELLVDRLLESDHYGEHMARYWLDLVRFADTNGMHKDFYRNNIAYRDWVIRAFNENLPYRDFVTYQIAGDLFPQPSRDQLIATGFHRLHLIIDRGTALPEESFSKNVIDRLTSVGTAFMGLTVQCAQCHDHKYDPISQQDFYSLYAFFNNIDAAPETEANPRYGLQEPMVAFPSDEQTQQLSQLGDAIKQWDAELGTLKKQLESLKANLPPSETSPSEKSALEKPALAGSVDVKATGGDRLPDDTAADVQQLELKINQLQQQRKTAATQSDQVDRVVFRAMVMRERSEVRPTHKLVRGQYDAPGELVERNTPGFLFALEKKGDVATRMDFANWLVDRQNPLTARVTVNRFWQQLFGVGLVKTSEDLGAQGEVPSHPELLDWLAVGFMDSDWNVKSMMKTMVMSETYQRSSQASREAFEQDPENRKLARGSRYRMDAEMIRDQILASSGLLSTNMYGPSVKPPQPPGLWEAVTMIGETYRQDSGDAIYRRSIYTYWKRGMPPPQMTIMNAPNRDACIARRERTNTPSQALLLLNESEYLKAARHLAQAALAQPEDRINFVWETITCRQPDDIETKAVQELVDKLTEQYESNLQLAEQLCQGAEWAGGQDKVQLATWTVVASTIYNLDITKTRE